MNTEFDGGVTPLNNGEVTPLNNGGVTPLNIDGTDVEQVRLELTLSVPVGPKPAIGNLVIDKATVDKLKAFLSVSAQAARFGAGGVAFVLLVPATVVGGFLLTPPLALLGASFAALGLGIKQFKFGAEYDHKLKDDIREGAKIGTKAAFLPALVSLKTVSDISGIKFAQGKGTGKFYPYKKDMPKKGDEGEELVKLQWF